MLGEIVWREFSARHPGIPALQDETIYSLTEGILETLIEKAPGFLSEEEIEFELDLAKTSPIGFSQGRPMGRGYFWPAGTPEEEMALDDYRRARESEVRAERQVQLMGLGKDDERADADVHGYEAAFDRVDDRCKAFLGWLITQKPFWDEVAVLRGRFGGEVAKRGFPAIFETWPPVEELDLDERLSDELSAPFFEFYGRWCLNSLFSWELPEPLKPVMNPPRAVVALAGAGPRFFVPWLFLRDDVVPLKDLLRFTRLDAPPQLTDWFSSVQSRGDAARGPKGTELLAYVYRYDVLVLSRRYGERINKKGKQGRRAAIDEVLAAGAYDADSIKRARGALKSMPPNLAASS